MSKKWLKMSIFCRKSAIFGAFVPLFGSFVPENPDFFYSWSGVSGQHLYFSVELSCGCPRVGSFLREKEIVPPF